MRLQEVLFFYACMGIAVALQVRGGSRALSFVLWPLFLPSLLSPPEERFETASPSAPASPITAAVRRLEEALLLWDHHLPVPLQGAERALVELEARRTALAALLARPENRVAEGSPTAQRRQSLTALVHLHDQLSEQIETALAHMDELSTRIQVAHFSGRSMADVGHQLSDLIGAVDRIQAVHDELDRDLRQPAA